MATILLAAGLAMLAGAITGFFGNGTSAPARPGPVRTTVHVLTHDPRLL